MGKEVVQEKQVFSECPFCKSKKIKLIDIGSGEAEFAVTCGRCHAFGPPSAFQVMAIYLWEIASRGKK